MTVEQLKLYTDFHSEFTKRCGYICHNLLKGLNKYELMTEFEIRQDGDEIDCWGTKYDFQGDREDYYEYFPSVFIYKSDEEILKWKNEMLEKQRKEKEEKEKLKQKREQDCEYQRYLELKRKFEK